MGFLAWIAYRQLKLSERNTRLEEKVYISNIYDRRFSVFKGAQEYLSVIARNAKCSHLDFSNFTVHIQQSYFLFGDEIHGYLKGLGDDGLKLIKVQSEKPLNTEVEKKLLKKITNELSKDGIFKKFKPYLEH